MKPKVISFDLQGTLSNSAFSNEFWFDLLPELFAKHENLPLEKAKKELSKIFVQIGKHDMRYYSTDYWLNRLTNGYSFKEMQSLLKTKPLFYKDTIPLLQKLQKKYKLIITSSTTLEFIDLELGTYRNLFFHIFSSCDNFHIYGKPPILYETIARNLNIYPNEIFHIGDDYEMDYTNAIKAETQALFFDKKKDRQEMLALLKKRFL